MNRPDWVTDEKQWLRDCRSVTTTCREYLAGTLGLIEASRLLVSCAHRLREDRNTDFTFFIALESETDHLPVGEYRNQWAADSLIAKDEEINSIEDVYRRDAVVVATFLLKRFQEAEQASSSNGG